MATATISGTVTYPIASGGPNASMVIGAPSVTPSSTSGPTLTFTEKSANTYVVPTGAPFTVPWGSLTDADILYLGTNQPVSVVFNGGTDIFSLPIGGFIMMYGASATGMQVTATLLEATIEVLIMGS